MMPVGEGGPFTHKDLQRGSGGRRSRISGRRKRIEAIVSRATEKNLPSVKILDTKKRRVKFKVNMIIMTELTN